MEWNSSSSQSSPLSLSPMADNPMHPSTRFWHSLLRAQFAILFVCMLAYFGFRHYRFLLPHGIFRDSFSSFLCSLVLLPIAQLLRVRHHGRRASAVLSGRRLFVYGAVLALVTEGIAPLFLRSVADLNDAVAVLIGTSTYILISSVSCRPINGTLGKPSGSSAVHVVTQSKS